MDRAQVHTLEAVVGSLLLVASIVFALQMTAVTPLSASTSSQHIENQLQSSAEGVLSGAAAENELKPALLAWDWETEAFQGTTSDSFYTSETPPNAFGERLERAFSSRGIAYNVYVDYSNDGGIISKRVVYRGEPSDNAVRAVKQVVLTDDDVLRTATMDRTAQTLNSTNFYAPDIDSTTGTHNVMKVEVVVWRI
jgi:hypothetical protein